VSGFLDWLKSPGTGPYGPISDVPGAPAGPSPYDVLVGAVQAPIDGANYANDAAGKVGRNLMLLLGAGIILFSVITSDE
jgi:hypothetical protein